MNQVILFLLILNLKYKTSITGNTYNVSVVEEGYDENKVGKNKTEVEAEAELYYSTKTLK